jgi:hypothetical protein
LNATKKLIEVALPLEAINKASAALARAIVEFRDADTQRVHYVRSPFQREPDFDVTSVNYDLRQLLTRAETPG